jgi:excisionase family DNA binding protein
MMDKLEPLAVSTGEAARLLGVSRPKVYELIGREDFPSFKLGRRTLVSVDGLKTWINNRVEEEKVK